MYLCLFYCYLLLLIVTVLSLSLVCLFSIKALLSAHDTIALKDYEPVLPPMPEDLPDDEEATRIVCLVKNKQPLVRFLS